MSQLTAVSRLRCENPHLSRQASSEVVMHLIRSILALEAAAFGAAAFVHSGTLIHGYEHSRAAIAESVIGLVLLVGLMASVTAPRSSRTVGLAAQAFALLGTFVGIFTIVIGVGPQTKLDIAFHVVLVAGLLTGLAVVARQNTDARSRA
jgi:hypothetical protein